MALFAAFLFSVSAQQAPSLDEFFEEPAEITDIKEDLAWGEGVGLLDRSIRFLQCTRSSISDTQSDGSGPRSPAELATFLTQANDACELSAHKADLLSFVREADPGATESLVERRVTSQLSVIQFALVASAAKAFDIKFEPDDVPEPPIEIPLPQGQ